MSAPLTDTAADAAARAAYWPIPIVRAVIAAALALVITFSADHSAQLGLLALGLFAVATGIALLVLAALRLRGTTLRDPLAVQGVVSIALGVAALVVRPAELPTLLVLLGSWAAATGLLELYAGIRARRRHPASADLSTVGVMTLVAAVVFALLPPDLVDEFTNQDGSVGVLDAAVVAVGVLGAYGAIIAVYLAIAGLSAGGGIRSAPRDLPETSGTTPERTDA